MYSLYLCNCSNLWFSEELQAFLSQYLACKCTIVHKVLFLLSCNISILSFSCTHVLFCPYNALDGNSGCGANQLSFQRHLVDYGHVLPTAHHPTQYTHTLSHLHTQLHMHTRTHADSRTICAHPHTHSHKQHHAHLGLSFSNPLMGLQSPTETGVAAVTMCHHQPWRVTGNQSVCRLENRFSQQKTSIDIHIVQSRGMCCLLKRA